jgi:1-acyl-sn-glycerol-3-phosphate acyltransferase
MASPSDAPLKEDPPLQFQYSPLADVGMPVTARLGRYPRVPDITFDALRAAARLGVVGALRAQYRLEVHGRPPDLPRLALLSNHRSHLDTPTVMAALPGQFRRNLVVLAARDYFFERPERAFAASILAQAVAFDRMHLSELRAWSRLLASQERGVLLVFPSGSRRRSEAHTGLLLILLASGWPLVPVAISGTAEAWPVGRSRWYPFRRLKVTFGEPLQESRARNLPGLLAAFWDQYSP